MIIKIIIILEQTKINTLANKWKSIPSIAIHDNEEKY